MALEKTKILCVDDDESVLEGLGLHLRRKYTLLTSSSGQQALDLLGKESDVAVILSDMRMPGMSGAEFLAQSRGLAPDASRMLLTGQTDLESAIAAINEGQIFRFLTKPCPPPALLAAFEAAIELHRLRTAEKVLLEQTLQGAVRVLVEVLSVASPVAFGRALRIKNLAAKIADEIGTEDRWQLEMAAMLSHLGFVALPPELVTKLVYGESLSEEDQKLAERVPSLQEQLLAPIPRLEPVREILARVPRSTKKNALEKTSPSVMRNTQILKAAFDFDQIEVQSEFGTVSVDALKGSVSDHPAEIIEALAKIAGSTGARVNETREFAFAALKAGMVLLQDVKTSAGVLVVPKGFEVTDSFIARIKNYPSGTLPAKVKALVRVTPA